MLSSEGPPCMDRVLVVYRASRSGSICLPSPLQGAVQIRGGLILPA